MQKMLYDIIAADQDWEEKDFIVETLEASGLYSINLSVPGDNFVLNSEQNDFCILVLSPEFLRYKQTDPMWTPYIVRTMYGESNILKPIKVRPCQPLGMLRTIDTIDLIGLGTVAKRKAILDGIKPGRTKPTNPPSFPNF